MGGAKERIKSLLFLFIIVFIFIAIVISGDIYNKEHPCLEWKTKQYVDNSKGFLLWFWNKKSGFCRSVREKRKISLC